MDRETARFCCDSEIMGYHVYQDVWEAEVSFLANAYQASPQEVLGVHVFCKEACQR